MLIRKIEMKDLDEVYKLLNELYENKIGYNVFIEKYKNSLDGNDFYGIVAEENNKIFGTLIARIVNRLVKSQNTLFVDEKNRQMGIGKMLLQNAIDYAKKKSCETLELTSYIPNESAHKFYENNGLIKHSYKFKKKL